MPIDDTAARELARSRRARGAARTSSITLMAMSIALGCASSPRPAHPRESAMRDEPIAPIVELESTIEGGARPAIVLVLENRGGSPVRLDDAHARFDVRRGAEPLPTCARAALEWIPLTHRGDTLAPHASRRFVAPLPPCAIQRDGEYTLFVDVVLGAEDPNEPAPSAMHLASRTRLRVARGRVETIAQVADASAHRMRRTNA